MGVAWGYNGRGQVGDRTITTRRSQVAIAGMGSGVTSVAGGGLHSLAVRDGAAYAWGYNGDGELGDGTTDQHTAAVAVTGLSSGVTAVAGGGSHSLAVRNGAAYAWGLNSSGAVGDGTTTSRTAPVAVTGLDSGVTAVAGGAYSSLAVRGGAAYAWGNNDFGQIGDGTLATRTAPVTVTGLGSGVTAVAAGTYHGLAVRGGAAYAWGRNDFGQLGDGTTTNRSAPVAVTSGLNSGVTAVAAGGTHSLALRNGNVFAWGYNQFGQLGDGTTAYRSRPFQINAAELTDITAIAASLYSSYALSADGSLWAWGFNRNGDLGLGTTTDQYVVPQRVLPPAGYRFTSIDADAFGEHAVATLEPVPEPASVALLAVGSVGLLSRRRPRQSV